MEYNLFLFHLGYYSKYNGFIYTLSFTRTVFVPHCVQIVCVEQRLIHFKLVDGHP